MLIPLLVLVACKKPAPPEPVLHDGPAGGAPSASASGGGDAPSSDDSRPKPPTSGGQVGAAVSDGDLAPVLGSYRDGSGRILRLNSGQSAVLDGAEVEALTRWCGQGELTLVCMQLKVAPEQAADSPWTVLVAQPDGALVQSRVGEGYAVLAPVSDGARFSPLGAPPALDALSADRRLQLDGEGAPLYCTEDGVISDYCDGYYHQASLLPLHSRLVEERAVVLVGPGPSEGCNPGVRIDQTLGAVDRVDLGRLATPVEPREDHVRAIARVTGIPEPRFSQAAWIDLDKDRREELVFELNADAAPSGRPGYSVVGYLGGGLDAPVLLEVHHGLSPEEPPPKHRIKGLVDLRGDGHLSLLVDVGGAGWVIWGKVDGEPRRMATRDCL